MTTPICFIDTETDRLHPGRKAWVVALIRREENGKETEEHFFLTIDLAAADPLGLSIGRFYDRPPAAASPSPRARRKRRRCARSPRPHRSSPG